MTAKTEKEKIEAACVAARKAAFVEAAQFLWWRALDKMDDGDIADYDAIKGVLIQFNKEFVK